MRHTENLQIELFGKTYNVNLIINKYANNNRLYLGLEDADNWEHFCDITENHPEISNDSLQFNLWDWAERVVLDNDFISCFDSVWDAKKWLMANIWDNLWGDEVNGRPCQVFYNLTN